MKRIHFSLALQKWHEWLVYSIVVLLVLSGIAWLLLDRFGDRQGDFGPEKHWALAWLLLGHGVLAYAFLIVVAMLVPVHMRLGWNAQRNRKSGLALVGISLFLAASGLALYYASRETLRALSQTSHWIVGLILPILLAVHLIRGKASRPEPRRR